MSHNEACYCLRNGATKFCDNCPTHRGGAAPPRPRDEAGRALRDVFTRLVPELGGSEVAWADLPETARESWRLAGDDVVRAALAASEQRARTEALEEAAQMLDRLGSVRHAARVRALSGRPTPSTTEPADG